MPEAGILIFMVVFGLLVGSFLNVVILRLPAGESIVFPPSRCPGCGKPIRWHDNIPLVSFILLRGKCRDCGSPVSWQYPLVELCTALLAAALYLRFGLGPVTVVYFAFCCALLAIIFIDFRHQIIPDAITLPGIVCGFGSAFFNPEVTWQSAGLGILLGGGSFYALAVIYYLITRREGMGGGDIKLLAMIGAFLGWQSLPFVIFGSSLMGTVAGLGAMARQKKGGKTVIPYGPFLSLAGMFYLFFQQQIRLFFQLYLLGQ